NYTTGGSVPVYAALVRENWRMREAGAIGQRLLHGASQRDPSVVDAAIAALMQLNAEVADHEFTGKQILQMAFAVSQEAFENGGRLPGITTGLSELDDILGGWHNSD